MPDLTNVSLTLKNLYLYRNPQLTKIDNIPRLVAIEKMYLIRNLIKKFPNLTNVSATLIEINLSYNEISWVKKLPPMAALEILNLGKNLLTYFPNVLNASGTLRRLELFRNEIRSIPEKLVAPLTKLEYLDLRENRVTELPNFCTFDHVITLRLDNLKFTCDWKMALVKMLDMQNRIVYYDDSTPECKSPVELARKVWADITIDELVEATGTFLYYDRPMLHDKSVQDYTKKYSISTQYKNTYVQRWSWRHSVWHRPIPHNPKLIFPTFHLNSHKITFVVT